jgi:hypothetical protein
MRQYTFSQRSRWLQTRPRPVARCPRCGYYEHSGAIARGRCHWCAQIAAGTLAPSPDRPATAA